MRGNRLGLIASIAALVVAAVTAHAAVRTLAGDVDSIPLSLPAATVTVVPRLAQATVPPTAQAPAEPRPRVTYRVTGNGGPVQVTYRNAEGATDAQTSATLPWELSFDGQGTAPLYVSAIAHGAASLSVTCEILVDGAPRSQSMSVGSSAIATCRTAAPRP